HRQNMNGCGHRQAAWPFAQLGHLTIVVHLCHLEEKQLARLNGQKRPNRTAGSLFATALYTSGGRLVVHAQVGSPQHVELIRGQVPATVEAIELRKAELDTAAQAPRVEQRVSLR